MRTWSKAPGSVRIPRGIGGTTLDLGGASASMDVTCSSGSLLVVGTQFEDVSLFGGISSATVTWGSESLSLAVFLENVATTQSAAIYYLIPQSSGTKTLTVTPNIPAGIGIWAVEVTLPAGGAVHSSSAEVGPGTFSLPLLGYTSESIVFGGGQPPEGVTEIAEFFDAPMVLGQNEIRPIGPVAEFFKTSGSEASPITGRTGQGGIVAVAAAFAITP